MGVEEADPAGTDLSSCSSGEMEGIGERGGERWPILIHVVEALLRVSLLGHQVSSDAPLDLPPRLTKFSITLASLSTKELLHEEWGYPHPLHKVVDAAPHQAGGSKTSR